MEWTKEAPRYDGLYFVSWNGKVGVARYGANNHHIRIVLGDVLDDHDADIVQYWGPAIKLPEPPVNKSQAQILRDTNAVGSLVDSSNYNRQRYNVVTIRYDDYGTPRSIEFRDSSALIWRNCNWEVRN